MTRLVDSLIASTSRALKLRKRPDLIFARHAYQSRSWWVVKDPVGLRYFRLADEEYALLNMLDGETSLEQMKDAFEQQFTPLKIGFESLSALLNDFHRKGLVNSDATGQGHELATREQRIKRQRWVTMLTNPLSIRFRGIDPKPVFDRLYPLVRWMFKPWAVAACMSLALAAVLLVAVHFEEFLARVPSFHQFFTFETTLWLMVVLGVTKILHESGHGLSCRHFGGECPEVGVMLLVMTPCLYCNVSDSWMLPSKWKRAMIGAAGMYVELILASIATFVWWYSNPGLLHHLALSTMFVCSVSTVMFNANPLLRYDGYYILSDLVEVPNLSQKASAVLRRLVTEWTLGLESRDDPFMPERGLAWYVAYAVASGVYRWVVTFSILLFLNEFFNPYRLEMLSYLLAIGAVFELIVQPVVSLVRFFRVPRPSDQYKRRRIQLTLAGLAAAAAIVLFLPIPHRVYGTLELEPYKPQNVFVEVPGELAKTLVRPGEHVEPGTILATLESDDLDLQIAELRGKCEQFRTKLASLRHRRFEDLAAGAQLPEVEKTLVAYEQQLAQKERDRDRLTLVAQRAGTVIPPPEQAKKDSPDHELATWTGSPFEPKNIGCHLDESTLLCQVGDPEQFEAIVVLDQADLGHVKVGQCVDLKLDEFPHDTFRSTIEEIARADLKVSPRHLSNKAGGELATKTDAKGVERPLSISYQARIPLRSPAGELRSGLCGRAKIYTPWESAAVRGWRWFSQTFHFRL